ncbi:uncharacterized protein LOC9660544 [Selaginella moellendorffii]|uniref:uncharacterized protein LOC9660544 n=1 Tax=Selaginella moellendorffii TaxID=88036 RepID=UPI000D1CD80F|nr:uncharacterized protein LOC9660544 [Selaginella moellendorffii]|eukprot:XP_024520473.1 uncharacterized protein LOC9660544 [Selaginella moellendorffii]
MNWMKQDRQEASVTPTPAPRSINSSTSAASSRVKLLVDLWSSDLQSRVSGATPPEVTINAPHIQDCKRCSQETAEFDRRKDPSWKGFDQQKEELDMNSETSISTVPWVISGDDDNIPLTRRVQRDIWLHQHPKNCTDARFLLALWHHDETRDSVGVGSDMVSMAGMLGAALLQGRVFITKDYHGARHKGCTGSNHARWSCYFFPEASEECMERALRLVEQKQAWDEGIIKEFSGDQWNGEIPSFWGEPWKAMRPTVGVKDKLMTNYHANHRRWWRAQALRYLTRFPSEYLCNLLNKERHRAFGEEVAKLVLKTLGTEWPRARNESKRNPSNPMEEHVWSDYGPWMPRPLLSIHVRQGDKASEMRVASFDEYMKLANVLRKRFPHVRNVWLSTEMQNVVDESKEYKGWKFYYSDVPRQVGTIRMAEYMALLGDKQGFDTAFINLVMAAECDFFVGVLGSTWSYIIDDLRMTSGKLKAGFLSVNSINGLLRK